MEVKRPKILVVDDVLDNVQLLGSILQPDYDITIALNGRKAMKLAESDSPPHLILLDVMMPEMDGLEVCRKLKEHARTREIPVIFVSGLSEVTDETMGFSVGGVDYITKPFSPPIVRARVKTHLALHDQNRILEEKVRERTLELLQTRDIAIFSLSSLAETRDNETGDHIRRTQYYMRLLALHLKNNSSYSRFLDDETIELLSKSAPLHDIGKVGIRDAVLLKPGPLIDEEFAIMKTHTTIGRDAITRGMEQLPLKGVSSFLQIAKEIAYSHHEKWDGSGYPEGLQGDDIPFSGRLMGVCDVYDAIISKRVYKAPLSHEDAVKIIRKGEGKQFDPEVSAAFLDLEENFLNIAYELTVLEEEKENLKKSLLKRGLK